MTALAAFIDQVNRQPLAIRLGLVLSQGRQVRIDSWWRRGNILTEKMFADEQAARGCSIVITATGAREPVLKGEWIEPGTHLNVVGSNFLSKAEVDVETIKRASIIAVDSIEGSKLEAGDLMPAIERGVTSWESVTELGRIVAGRDPGRTSEDQVTLFKSNGIALEDISTALRVYRLARERGVGEEIDLWRG